ncbi:M28 family peptidase [Tamlana sp. 62-3]|uniref:M28 family peptidase n=1 Tax=Neotamlana sargassicola TaxID=2883125 RepID=A0A9X1I6A9_9FLAO|nr:M28 family peptidase [Tamlana sargassicola]MCB4806986.1 M28 family peptidase [Tamlana sargassicola]
MKHQLCIIILAFFTGILTHSQTEIQQQWFNEKELLKHIKTLSSDAFEGRRTGTPGAEKTKKYIINQFHALGVKPLTNKYRQNFTFSKGVKQYQATNILGYIKGTSKQKKYIVITAHFDHEGIKRNEIYNGADDNASGIGALFSFAEYFKNNPPKHTVILAALDAEELGLKGSYYFTKNPLIPLKNIIVNINLDMVSRSDKKELFVVGTDTHNRFKNIVNNYKNSEQFKLVIGHDANDNLENWTYSSDHANFYKKGVPFLYFGVEDHEDYHEPTDDFENIHPEFYIKAVHSIISVFKAIDTQL